MNARKQYLEEVRKEYREATKSEKGRLLNEARRRTKLNRKYLTRRLNGEDQENAETAAPAQSRLWRRGDHGLGEGLGDFRLSVGAAHGPTVWMTTIHSSQEHIRIKKAKHLSAPLVFTSVYAFAAQGFIG